MYKEVQQIFSRIKERNNQAAEVFCYIFGGLNENKIGHDISYSIGQLDTLVSENAGDVNRLEEIMEINK